MLARRGDIVPRWELLDDLDVGDQPDRAKVPSRRS